MSENKKFKIGDQVVVTANTTMHSLTIGSVAKVVCVHDFGLSVNGGGETDWFVHFDDVDPILAIEEINADINQALGVYAI